MKSRKGFTLIELLVVIAIIAILAAILFPVFAMARAKARAASCLSNVKQLVLAFHMYSNDWDEYLPAGVFKVPGITLANGNPMVLSWPIGIMPYVKTKQLFNCPGDPNGRDGMSYVGSKYTLTMRRVSIRPRPVRIGKYVMATADLAIMDAAQAVLIICGPWNVGTDPHMGYIDTYGFRDVPCGGPGPIDRWFQAWIGPFTPPSTGTWAGTYDNTEPGNVFDQRYGTNAYPANVSTDWRQMTGIGSPGGGIYNLSVHNGGANAGFVDGHAKWVRVESLRTAPGSLAATNF